MCSLFSDIYTDLFNFENMSINVRKYCIDTCDVMYNMFIYLLPPIVLDNLFASKEIHVLTLMKTENILNIDV